MNTNRSKRWTAVFVGLLMISATLLLHAHTELEKSEPASGTTLSTAPKQIRLSFNEKVDLAVSKIEMTSAGAKLGLGPLVTADQKSLLAPVTGKIVSGIYSVAWQTVGEDGHVVKGTFNFTVKLSN